MKKWLTIAIALLVVVSVIGGSQAKTGKKIIFGMPFPDMHDEALVAFKANLEKFAASNSRPIDIRFTNADSDLTKQAGDIKDLISQNVNVMMIMPIDSKGFSPSIKACKDAKIPALGFSWPIAKDSQYQTDVFVGIDTENQSYAAMTATFQKMKADGVKSTGVIIVSGDLRNELSLNRTAGVKRACAEWKVPVLVDVPGNWDPLTAASGLAAALKAYPNANTLACHSDSMLAGVQQALEQADKWYPRGNKKHMYFATVDVFPLALDYLRKNFIDADTLYDIVGMCKKTIEVLVELADGKTYGANQRDIEIQGPVFNSDNVDKPEMQAMLWKK